MAQLAGVGRIVPSGVNTVRDAYAVGAARFVHGYFERRGGTLHFEFSIEDGRSHKMLETLTMDGPVLEVAGRLARAIDAGAHAFSSDNAAAVEAWGRRDFARAVSLDPDFGAAWLGWIRALMGAGQNDEARQRAAAALKRGDLRSPIDRANIRVLDATLRGDPAARGVALEELLRRLPNDANLAETLAENALNGRRYKQAEEFFRDAMRLDPQNASAHNLLGYTLAYAGDLEGARREFDQYAKYPGHEANALDSQGEALFLWGRFADAERYFLDAHTKDPNLLEGSDLLKAAYARWLDGEVAGAGDLFDRYIEFRTQHGDPLVVWRRAVWEYATGGRAVAIQRLQGAQGPAAALAQRQLAVWNRPEALPQDPEQLRQAYERTPPGSDGLVRVLYARALAQAGHPEEARKLLQLYPLPESGDQLLEAYLYPLYLELRGKVEQGRR